MKVERTFAVGAAQDHMRGVYAAVMKAAMDKARRLMEEEGTA